MINRSSQSGLTLPEVLIAVAVLAAIAAALAPSVRATSRAALAMQDQAVQHEELRASRDILQRIADTAIWVGSETPDLHARGSIRSFQFGTYDPAGIPVVAKLQTGDTGLTLLLTPLMHSNDPVLSTTILQNVRDLSLSYYGASSNRAESSWHQSWQRAKPPQLLRLSGKFVDQPFILDIPLAGQAPIVCEFDPVSRLCRNAA